MQHSQQQLSELEAEQQLLKKQLSELQLQGQQQQGRHVPLALDSQHLQRQQQIEELERQQQKQKQLLQDLEQQLQQRQQQLATADAQIMIKQHQAAAIDRQISSRQQAADASGTGPFFSPSAPPSAPLSPAAATGYAAFRPPDLTYMGYEASQLSQFSQQQPVNSPLQRLAQVEAGLMEVQRAAMEARVARQVRGAAVHLTAL